MTAAGKRVGVLLSGRGSNMMALVEASRAPGCPYQVVVVVSSEPNAPGLAWAKAQGIPALGLNWRHYESREHFEGQIQGVLTASRVDLVALAGFMRLMTPDFVNLWHNRMLNIHPSLLPAFKGLHTHQRALDAGVRISGCTVHLVRAEMDDGPILGQAAVPVEAGDTSEILAARILNAEHDLYPRILSAFAAGEIHVSDEKVSWPVVINQPTTLFSPDLSSTR
jgi:phosphoribosylglycinamide formyltransferase-1